MSGYSVDEILDFISNIDEQDQFSPDVVKQLAPSLCRSPPELQHLISGLAAYRSIPDPDARQRACAGKHLESIAALAFAGLRGVSRLEQIKTLAAEYDLIVSGDRHLNPKWAVICKTLGFNSKESSILIEVKATSETVSDAQFLRLCAIRDAHFDSEVGLAVFFTIKGASGFPNTKNGKVGALRNAYMHQALYYARKGIPVVVLDYDDVIQMSAPGALLAVIRQRIDDLRTLTGRRGTPPSACPRGPSHPHLYLAERYLKTPS